MLRNHSTVKFRDRVLISGVITVLALRKRSAVNRPFNNRLESGNVLFREIGADTKVNASGIATTLELTKVVDRL